MALNQILAVIDPTQQHQPAAARAFDTAKITGAGLHMYCCAESESAKAAASALLEKMAAEASGQGINASTELEINTDWRDMLIGAASRCAADMVFKHSVAHSDVDREKRATADWNLLRMSPCPVLMVKDFNQWQGRRILAAINTLSTDEQHRKLNAKIISFARRFADAYGSDAHFVNAFQDRNHEPVARQLAELCGVPLDHIHVDEGITVDVISERAQLIGADLVIIGTVGRTGIKARVVGNTSERLLDHTDSDILVLN